MIDKIPQDSISLTDLKSIFKKPTDSLLDKLKKKLNHAIKADDWSIGTHSDDDAYLPEVADCVIYCFTAHIAYRFCTVQCELCKRAIFSSDNCTNNPIAMLANMRNENPGDGQLADPFIHPTLKLYNFVKCLEDLFTKHRSSPYVYDLMLNEAFECQLFSFTCMDHAQNIITSIVHYYVSTKMINYSNNINREDCRNNQFKKKTAKLCKT